MEIKIECPWCKQHYSVEESFIGQNVECSVCNKQFEVKKPNGSVLSSNNSMAGISSMQKDSSQRTATVNGGKPNNKKAIWIGSLAVIILLVLCGIGTLGVLHNKHSAFAKSIEEDQGRGFYYVDKGKTLMGAPKDVAGYDIPYGVTAIDDSAFKNCKSLKSVTIPDSVTSIGKEAFYNCTSLTGITIPNGIKKIEKKAFSGCSSLSSITMPDSVIKIEEEAFSNCSSLKDVMIPSSVTGIGNKAFFNCFSLSNVTISMGVIFIWDEAFSNCSSLKSVTIPSSVTTIGRNVFLGTGCEAQIKRDYPHLFK